MVAATPFVGTSATEPCELLTQQTLVSTHLNFGAMYRRRRVWQCCYSSQVLNHGGVILEL